MSGGPPPGGQYGPKPDGGINMESMYFKAMLIGALLLTMYLIEFIDFFSGGELSQHGIVPRTGSGFVGILFSPFLHTGWGHLGANTLPFIILGGFLIMRGTKEFIVISSFIALAGGFCVWLMARPNTNHIGASGVIFGYFGYLMLIAFLERPIRVLSIVSMIVVAIIYGTLIFGVAPLDSKVSWEGHVFGLLTGIGAAFLYRKWQRVQKQKEATRPGETEHARLNKQESSSHTHSAMAPTATAGPTGYPQAPPQHSTGLSSPPRGYYQVDQSLSAGNAV
eukprot:GFYU01004860.1.p1 GENE.GFYU01004860.1~~GFYU01004860.1.p1  ORF type:complete len:279 (+),score=51.82 GFYU01004860.1:201-1037(+)